VLQVIVNVIDHDMNMQQAISAPRVHHQWMPDQIRYEPNGGLNADTRRTLEGKGHVFAERGSYMGDAQGIMAAPSGMRLGASDPRSGGKAVGY
jgi:gamma-glutamyltranspeptidase/glutathione hydrolase